MQKIIVIIGPTAVGKTALSLALGQQLNGEIVSVDSMQVYRHLDIGTAKATPEEQALVPHHMLDLVEPDQPYSVAQFIERAQGEIAAIGQRGHTPIIVGGTGFYIQALLGDRPLAKIEEQPDPDFEATWDARVQNEGEAPLRQALAQLDPISAERILPGQIRRLKRALLVSQQTGQPFSDLQPEPKRIYDAYIIGLNTERSVLYDRINKRVDDMLEAGLLDEARLVQQLPDSATAKKAIGYKELFGYLDGTMSLEAAKDALKQASRRYAKRQLTWFNNQMHDVDWVDLVQNPDTLNDLTGKMQEFMSE
ncbi:tRNA dimethylallyltransferase [Weissella uvarum]|uniref:tRNA (adenosine(37)-N6)-dimethylallyltransferase MiaA n=1 Tax=Weissella uvarum TaxID=1479233 RepID=UPI0019605420|nr:tRNA (adenosine(37)-N6)-dimethylallyltransferase MiaA [Weissella uvarum]MBM7616631.1 tRNA dimethylallyltransferase [Weissella uvarum]MCM0594911.1 tRNA (adenosine(37)-N6)-dimethylallyltransferase MiaA [Weissella uvarum]